MPCALLRVRETLVLHQFIRLMMLVLYQITWPCNGRMAGALLAPPRLTAQPTHAGGSEAVKLLPTSASSSGEASSITDRRK